MTESQQVRKYGVDGFPSYEFLRADQVRNDAFTLTQLYDFSSHL
jgi:hypothetical protein